MKSRTTLWFTFTRSERLGLAILMLFLCLLVALYASLPYFMHPPQDAAGDLKMVQQWHRFISHRETDTAEAKDASMTPNWVKPGYKGKRLPNRINLNKADSLTLLDIRYMTDQRVHKILAYRRTFGWFVSFDEMQRKCNFKKEELAVILPHLDLGYHPKGVPFYPK